MIDLVKKYVENRVELVTLSLIGAIANVAAGMVSSFLLLVMGILILLMFSIAMAFWFATFFESEIVGFALVGLLYLILFIVYAAFAKKGVETRIKDKIVESALSEYDEHVEEAEDEI
jgi:membrane protein implicated in regulation of membrane protease activity